MLRAAIEHLYATFSGYRVTDYEALCIFDFGPTEEELESVSAPLREVPLAVVRSMEFYDPSWESWGTEAEVKHFLPRILELVADDPGILWGSAFSLFKYKLHGALTGWSEAEAAALRAWIEATLDHHLAEGECPKELIEAAAELGLTGDEILARWGEATVEGPWRHSVSEDPAVLAVIAEVARRAPGS